MDTHKTKVIFRWWPMDYDCNASVIAIFPEEPGNSSPFTCMSYQHIGQHGNCDPTYLIREVTRPATEQEYKDLFDELTSIGYNLQVCKRYTYAMQCRRADELKRINDEADRILAEQESNYLHSIGG